jgi:molybdenum cofactor cytidylyltransferase
MSTRMGAAKPLLPFGESTLLETVIATARRSQVDQILIVLGASADEIRRKISFEQMRVVVNEDFHDGMGTSLRCGVAQVTTDAALIVLGDQPLVESATLDRLIAEYREKHPQIAIPVYRGFRGNPVLLDRSVFPEIMGLSGDIGCRAIFGGHSENILKVPVDDIGVLLDIDTPANLEKLRNKAALSLEAADLSGREMADKPQLVIVGSEKVGRILAQLARLMNFSVTIVDPFLRIEEAPGADLILHELEFSRFAPGAFVVIASGGRFDEEAIEQATPIQPRYVALVANKKRAREVLNRVSERIDPERLSLVRSKAGIDIGAEGPEEIALSIMAEIIAERHRTA